MPTPVADFSYDLPEELIAQVPIEPRDASRLLVLDRNSGEIRHRDRFAEILDELNAGDVLVFNVSKVFKARLQIDGFEVFVLKVRDGEIDVLIRGSRKLGIGSAITVETTRWVVSNKTTDGIVTLKSSMTAGEMFAFCESAGSVPTPPYVTTELADPDRYQTVYARSTGSVAAPTAGLHFTPELIDRARAKGVQIEEVTLHVGIGTFRPVQTDHIEDHVMHAEFVEIDELTAQRIRSAKSEGCRVIAVGTTTVRVLEGVVATIGELAAYSGEVNMFITPGFQFQIVDGLITNFHLPKSTLLMLVSAFADREHILAAYKEAIDHRYRFFSFGDAMFIR
ncbi:MAG: tRNA preQ1(34) S-adenosylmethionine ribosyltransferase-isomerase QueA [Patescibacteria group bacterium]